MVNFTQTVSPDVIDITSMVFMALFSMVCHLISGALLSYNTIDATKKGITVLIGMVLVGIGFLVLCFLITNSIDAGIEWQKLRM